MLPGYRGTIGGEVGCGGVARGTSGAFRWYRWVEPLRVRIGRSVYHGPMNPRPTPATPHESAPVMTGSLPAAGLVAPTGAFDGRPGLPDRFGRALRDLRISVTDRCNFRCPYCMPAEMFGRDFAFLPKALVLTFEEITRLAAIFVAAGVGKLRITGGEPLVRRDLPVLIASLSALRTPDGEPVDLTLTTNGTALRSLAGPLAEAGLQRITVSLDSLDDAVFGAMNGVDFPISRVLDGIAAARSAGLAPIKVNTVVRRGMNEESDPAAGPLGTRVGADPSLHRVHGRGPLERLAPGRRRAGGGDPRAHRCRDAARAGRCELPWRGRRAATAYRDGSGEIGVIASVTRPFCGDCTRARLSAEGHLYTCLFAVAGVDLKTPLRAGESDAELAARIRAVWAAPRRTATPSCAARRPATSRRWRCSPSAAERLRPPGRPSTPCPQRGKSRGCGRLPATNFVDNPVGRCGPGP